MKSLVPLRCLVIATMLMTTVPQVGTAQESLPNPSSTSEPQPTLPSVAERRFVSDKLVLNVYADPDQGSARVATIQTGDAVDEIERVGNQVHVRLEDGREGWVGANYLVSDAPAVVRLRELQRQQQPAAAPKIDKALADEVVQLKRENTTLREQVNSLQARVTAAESTTREMTTNPGVTTNAASMPDAATDVTMLASATPARAVWGWLVALMFVGAVSFTGGYQTLARRLRKKFGGLKIY